MLLRVRLSMLETGADAMPWMWQCIDCKILREDVIKAEKVSPKIV